MSKWIDVKNKIPTKPGEYLILTTNFNRREYTFENGDSWPDWIKYYMEIPLIPSKELSAKEKLKRINDLLHQGVEFHCERDCKCLRFALKSTCSVKDSNVLLEIRNILQEASS